MEQKVIPEPQELLQQIVNESKLPLPDQRIKMLERLMNFPPEKFSEIHIQEWYKNYWNLVNLCQYLQTPPQELEAVTVQILNFAARQNNPIRNQCAVLALLLFGRFQEAQSLMNQNLWTAKMRQDFETFLKFKQLITSPPFETRALVWHNQNIKKFLQDKYSDLIQKYAQMKFDETTCPKVAQKDYQIYFCWLQGKENMPPLIRCCYNSLKMNAGNFKICFIDENNYSDYVDIPEHIIKKSGGGWHKSNSLFRYFTSKPFGEMRRLVARRYNFSYRAIERL